MGKGSKPGVALSELLAYPLLLECDSSGKVLWISQRGREILGEPEYLSDLVLATDPGRGCGGLRLRVYSWHFWRVWEWRNTVVVGARPLALPDRSQIEFLRLEARLVQGFIRLVEDERHLGERARRRRGGSGGYRGDSPDRVGEAAVRAGTAHGGGADTGGGPAAIGTDRRGNALAAAQGQTVAGDDRDAERERAGAGAGGVQKTASSGMAAVDAGGSGAAVVGAERSCGAGLAAN